MNDFSSPCQGNDRCIARVADTATKCAACKLACCKMHSIKINGDLLCEICINRRFATSQTSGSGSQDRGRLDTAPGAYVSALALSQRYSDEDRLDIAADFLPGDEDLCR